MPTLTIEAVYEAGVLRPLRPLELPEHTRVRLIVEPAPEHPLADCIGIMPDEDAEEMRRIVEEESLLSGCRRIPIPCAGVQK